MKFELRLPFDQIVVCNRIALSVIEACRGEDSTFVFTYQGKPLKRMHNSAWNRAWKQVGVPTQGYLKGAITWSTPMGGDCGQPVYRRKHAESYSAIRRQGVM